MYYYPFYINYCLISISVEGLKLIEIERCKKDISDIKNQLHESQKRLGDFNRLRWESFTFLLLIYINMWINLHIAVEGLQLVEVEKCKRDISNLKTLIIEGRQGIASRWERMSVIRVSGFRFEYLPLAACEEDANTL